MDTLAPWNMLAKRLIWRQLGEIEGKRILDFGSGEGVTADHFALNNNVIAIEPDPGMIGAYKPRNTFEQLVGGVDILHTVLDAAFDVILCHNVLEYVRERNCIIAEFERLLAPGGLLSVVRHNRNGRIMQMVVLLNNFEHANGLLDGAQGKSGQFGPIGYYTQDDLEGWAQNSCLEQTYGLRCFWHLQQNQAVHAQEDWQENMLEMEMRVSGNPDFQAIAAFHHHLLRKKV